MKKLFALLIAAALLLTAGLVVAETISSGAPVTKDPVKLEGYSIGDSSGDTLGMWIAFTDENPGEVETLTANLTTYAAAYCDGYLYGYCYGYNGSGELISDFYYINMRTRVVTYPGTNSGGEFVFGMAYNRLDGTMYALVDEDHPYIAAVDLETAALTRVVDIDLGSYLGLMTFAIDGEGNFLALTMSALSARLLKIDMQTGALTEIGNTGVPCYYAQSMTYDYDTDMIYWAQCESPTSSGLYRLDPRTAQATSCGRIGPDGIEVMGLYVAPELGDEPDPTPEPTEPPVEYMLGDIDGDGEVAIADAILAMRSSIGVLELTEAQTLAGDVNLDGNVDVTDALLIMRYAMGLIESF